MRTLINTLDFKEWISDVGKSIGEQFQDLFHDFAEVFDVIKAHTYDVLCEHFGSGVVNLFGITLIFVIIMLVSIKIINR